METVYQCEYCGEVFSSTQEAMSCEMGHEQYNKVVKGLQAKADKLKERHAVLQQKIKEEL